MGEIIFKTIIDKVKFNFVPVTDSRDGSVYGYKIIKSFDEAGYDDKEDVYELAYEDGVLEFFLLRLQEKAYQAAIKEKLTDKKIFHTLRANYIEDAAYYYAGIESLIAKFQLNKDNIVYEIKGASDWKNLNQFLQYTDEDAVLMFKEMKGFPLNQNMLRFLEPQFAEVASLESAKILKNNKHITSKIVYKIREGEKYTNKELLEAGIDYTYKL